MNRLIKRILILGGIFLVAAIAFLWFTREPEDEAINYSAMESASIPVVTLEAEETAINVLYGYVADMEDAYVAESLTPLAEDRRLPITIDPYGNAIKGISYEIRSLDGSNLVEEIALEQWETVEGQIKAVLPIQDLIREGTEYNLKLTLNTDRHGSVDYYTRIVRNGSLKTKEMLDYITDFHASTFVPAEAEKYAINWEVDATGDNDTLAKVTIHSAFSQLTWADFSPIQIGDPQFTILEMDETFGSFKVRFEVQAEGGNNRIGTYIAEEFFCLQWSEVRFYLMSYERTMTQVFEASMDTFTDETIEFGVVQEEDVALIHSPNKTYHVFTVGGDLWSYSTEKREAVLLFSFREDGEEGPQRLHQEYDVQLVDVDDEGNVEFFVYGYMNRGEHEGQVGLSYYRYVKEDNALQEIFYVSSDKSYQVLKEGIDTLSHKEGELLYLLFDNNVYAVDYQGKEVVVVVENADTRGLVVNDAQDAIAWQLGEDLNQADSIQVLYLSTKDTNVYAAESGEYLRTQGFIGQDFIYSIGRRDEVQAEGFEMLYPQYALVISSPEGEEEARYQFDNIYISGIAVSDGQVHLERLRKTGSGYERLEDDTLMQNITETDISAQVLSHRSAEKQQRVWYLPVTTSGSRQTLNVAAPNRMLYNTDTALRPSGENVKEQCYYAYSYSELKGIYEEAGDAIMAVYDDMGWVTDSYGNRVWHRTAKGGETVNVSISSDAAVPTAANRMEGCLTGILRLEDIGEDVGALIGEGHSAQEILEMCMPGKVVNLSGCTLKQIFYYLGRKLPVIVISEDDTPLLLVGYDPYNVDVYDPVRGETYKMGQQDATDAFERAGNRFLGYIR